MNRVSDCAVFNFYVASESFHLHEGKKHQTIPKTVRMSELGWLLLHYLAANNHFNLMQNIYTCKIYKEPIAVDTQQVCAAALYISGVHSL